MTVELFLYAIAGGATLGAILALSRKHMTGTATFSFSMLYYVLFTGFINARRFITDQEVFGSHFANGLHRALVFATVAALVVFLVGHYRRRELHKYMRQLEEDNRVLRED